MLKKEPQLIGILSANVKFRRSLYFVKDIKWGEVMTNEYIRSIRPGYGLAPKYLYKILEKKVGKSIKKGSPATWSLITSV